MFIRGDMTIIEDRRDDETARMKKRILKAAFELFIKYGIEKVTIRKIAAKIRYSPGTIYNYYRNKNDIFLALRREGFALFREYQLRSRGIKSAWKRILAHGREYLRFALENPEYYELMFIMKAPMDEVMSDAESKKTQQSYQFLKDDITLGIKEGLIKKTDADVAALAFWSIGHGLASLMIRKRLTMFDTKNQRQLIEKAAAYLYQSVATARKL